MAGVSCMNEPTTCQFVVFFKRPEPFKPPEFPRQRIVDFIRRGDFFRKEPRFQPARTSPRLAEPQWFSLDIRVGPGNSFIHVHWSDWNHVSPHFLDPWKHLVQGILVDAHSPNVDGVTQGILDSTDGIWVLADPAALTDEFRKMLGGLRNYLAKTLAGIVFVPGEGVYDQDARLLVPLLDARFKSSMHCQTFGNSRARYYELAISPDANIIGTGGDPANKAMLWDAATGEAKQTLVGHKRTTRAIAFSPDGSVVATGSEDKLVILWETATGKARRSLFGHGGIVGALAFSPDGNILASGGYDGGVVFLDMPSGERRTRLDFHGSSVMGFVRGTKWHSDKTQAGKVCSLAFSPDGMLLASGGTDGTVRLCDVNSGTLVRTLEGYPESAWPVAFSPNGKLLAAGSYDRTVRLWDVATGVMEGIIAGHAHYVFALAFSPDSRWLATGSTDTLVRVWDAATRVRLCTFHGHSEAVYSVKFFPDGRKLASASHDGTVRLWSLAEIVKESECQS